MEKEKSSKKLLLPILGVVVLVLISFGVSYAMFSFAGLGTKENVITTGSITVVYTDTTNISLTGLYPESDSKGMARNASYCSDSRYNVAVCTANGGTILYPQLDFTVTSTMTSATVIDYEIGLVPDVNNTLEDSEVKIWALKLIGGADQGYPIAGTTSTSGVLISSIAASGGSLTGTTINGYKIASSSFNQNGASHQYIVKAWVDENYDLPTTVTGTSTITGTTTSETYNFKIKIYARQSS